MNWIERMYELKGKDLYSQNGEGLYLEYIFNHIPRGIEYFIDIGGGDGFYLSNTRHLKRLGWNGAVLDLETGYNITADNIIDILDGLEIALLSIDIDGNDYWVIQKILSEHSPGVITAEFNASFTDSRSIVYNPNHVWAGDNYYGFTFDAGKKLAEANGYKVIFQIADMNMVMVREDLINVSIPPVTYQQSDYFKMSERTDWITI